MIYRELNRALAITGVSADVS
nr:hypothetical protein [Escherichia coli]